MSVIPKCTSWLGHKFEARFSVTPPGAETIGRIKGEGYSLGILLDGLSKKAYEGEVCVRCGYRLAPLGKSEAA